MALRCLPLSCVCGDFFFPQRKLLVIMLFLAICYSYIMRIVFHMALLYLRQSPDAPGQFEGSPHECCDCLPAYVPYQTWKAYAEYWNWLITGFIMASYFIGYFAAQITCLYCSKLKPKMPLLFAMALQAVFFMLIPTAVELHWFLICFVRLLQGFCAGFVYYFSSSMTSEWIPTNDRGVVNIFLFSASHLGSIIGPFSTVSINDSFETWTTVFYIFGGLTLLWCLFFFLLCYNNFRVHPYILKKEYDYLQPQIALTDKFKRSTVPMKKILQSRSARALIFATIGHDFGFYLYLNFIFWFMYVRKYGMLDIGLTVSYSFVALYFGSIIFAVIRSYCDRSKCVQKLCQRKIFTSIGMIGPAIMLLAMALVDCRSIAGMVLALVQLFLMGAYYSGVPLNIYDIAPIHAEKLAIVLNIFGTFQGILSAIAQAVLLYILNDPEYMANIKPWLYMFCINIGICFVCWLLYMTTASVRRAEWDYVVTGGRKSDQNPYNRTNRP